MPDNEFWRRRVTIYLYHFSEPFGHASHYLGSAEDYEQRAAKHLSGQGASLLKAVRAAGISWELARQWNSVPRFHEARLHKMKANKGLCPTCSGKKAYNRGNYIEEGNVNNSDKAGNEADKCDDF